jgi:hypothetical protein
LVFETKPKFYRVIEKIGTQSLEAVEKDPELSFWGSVATDACPEHGEGTLRSFTSFRMTLRVRFFAALRMTAKKTFSTTSLSLTLPKNWIETGRKNFILDCP